MNHRTWIAASLLAAASAALLGCPEEKSTSNEGSAKPATSAPPAASSAHAAASAALPPMPPAPPIPPAPEGLGEMKVPADNPLTPEKVALGKQLFFDKRLGKANAFSCETCHVPEKGWTDGEQFSKKADGKLNTRHSPTLYNVGYNEAWYWDGRAATLEKQVEAAWKGQMGANEGEVCKALGKIPGYETQFKTIFGHTDPTPDDVVKAIASYVRTIRSGDSPWDKHEKGDKKAVGKDVEEGWKLFREKAGCAACHAPPLFTDNGFHDTGIGFDKPEPDLGRGKVTKDEKMNGAFKTPTMRSVTTHPPYFHDGSGKTLDDAVDFMLSGGIKKKNPNLDPHMKAVKLSKKEKESLMAFLKALNGAEAKVERPKLPE
ncbi:MAG TPA: cytochrome c peroxidase [Minicystis sp.]|nr:cytochrome c peroxidase [Minicystis sp.]